MSGRSGLGSWRHSRRLRLLVLMAAVAAVFAAVYATGLSQHLSLDGLARNRGALKDVAADHPVLAPLVFMVVHAIAVSFPVAAIFKVMAGFLFGWAAGGLYAVVAATIGATVLFLLARRTAGGLFADEATGTRVAGLAREFETGAFSYVLAMRLAPFIPFFAVSVAPAMFNVRLAIFVAATVLGMLPAAFSLSWLGQGLDDAFDAASAEQRPLLLSDMITPEITGALLALTLVAVLAAIIRRVRGLQAS